jgi:hypothetical protein
MRIGTIPPVVTLALVAVGCGMSGNDGEADSVSATIAADDETADTTGEPQPNAGASLEVEPYLRAVEASAATLGRAVERLFTMPLGLETEEIAERLQADGSPTSDITDAEEATLRRFFTTFWADAAGHVAVMGDDLRALDPPDAVRAQHDAYVAALEAIVDSTDERVADIHARDVADLPDILWEPDDELAAMEAACAALEAEAARLGIDAETCPQ